MLGSRDEKRDTKEHTVEHWARSEDNPIGGWYGLKKNFRGRLAMYIPPLMEFLVLAEVEHNARDNRMRFGKELEDNEISVRNRHLTDSRRRSKKLLGQLSMLFETAVFLPHS